MSFVFDSAKPIAIGSDHAGFAYKAALLEWLSGKGYPVKDFGSLSADSVDYPDFAHPVATSVENGESAFGILMCGTANGVAMTANKHPHIRAALCWQNDIAVVCRQHNNANIICIPSRFVSLVLAQQMIELFMTTIFEGGRHATRVTKIACS
jgi:ribose 5-phosphate isomerase B